MISVAFIILLFIAIGFGIKHIIKALTEDY